MGEVEIWDGNGGKLDAKKTPQRDLLVALHVKMDSVVIPGLSALDEWRRRQDSGEFSIGQAAAVRAVLEDLGDKSLSRRSSRASILAVAISVIAVVSSVSIDLLVR